MSKHAILSPSGAARWLACTPSARLEEQFPDRAGEAAAEGTVAHALGELLIDLATGAKTKPQYFKEYRELVKSSYYNSDMQDLIEGYRDYVLTEFEEAKKNAPDAELITEAKLDLTKWVEDGFGTADVQIIADGTLNIIDLKYGKGVLVSAENNKQMMLYALGAYEAASAFWDIRQVKMTIYQPRMDNVSSYLLPVEALLNWADTELVPRAKMAYAGEGSFAPGGHCLFCKAKVKCRAYAEKQLEIAKYEFRDGCLLDGDEISDILTRASEFKNWIGKVEEFALAEAIDNGVKWPGYKLVEGRSNRIYSDTTKVADKLTKNGIPEDKIYEKKLLGITAMEKAITKKKFSELLSDLVIKPQGKPALVPESDKRPEWNSAASAAKDFDDDLDNLM